MPHNFIVAYPDDGTRRRDFPKGELKINFWDGVVTDPDGTETKLKSNLKDRDQNFIRSVVVYCTLGTKIKLGNDPAILFADQCNWNVFENLNITEMSITAGFTGTPDTNEIQVFGFTGSQSFFKPEVVKIHQFDRVSGQASTDAYATLFEKHINQYNHNTFIITETGATNGITYKIEVKQTSTGTYTELQGDTTIAAGANDIVQIEGAFHFVKVSVKATVGSSQGTLEFQWLGQG